MIRRVLPTSENPYAPPSDTDRRASSDEPHFEVRAGSDYLGLKLVLFVVFPLSILVVGELICLVWPVSLVLAVVVWKARELSPCPGIALHLGDG